MGLLEDIVVQIELHSVEGIRRCFAAGLDPNERFNGRPLIEELLSEYTRSPRFSDCVRTFINHGLEMADPVLQAVLTNDAPLLEQYLHEDPDRISRRYSFRSAYTPIEDASLLHICAEFNLVACAEALLKYGADVNFAAGVDEDGFGGQTPIFHTVNQNTNQSAGMLDLLVAHSADLSITVTGLVWGKGYEWETLLPSVNPISYAMMGLLPQMHRDEKTIARIVSRLLKQRYGIHYQPRNVPCAYLTRK